MLQKITMPDAGQTTDQLVVAKWLKNVGDRVARGDVLAEVETDKATVAVESFASGTLLKRLVQEGETASAGDVIAWIGDGSDLVEEAQPVASPVPLPPAQADAIAPTASPSVRRDPARALARPSEGLEVPVRASPAAKKAAREAGLDIRQIARATNKAVVRRADVLGFRAPPPPAPAAATDGPRARAVTEPAQYELLRLTSTRKLVAARMVQSATTIPAFTLETEVDMTRCIALRDELNAQAGDVRIAFHDILAKCIAVAAKKHPLVNASYADDGIHAYRQVNVGLAVAREEGLVVPVVRDVGGKTLAEVARENAERVAAARDGTLRQESLEGCTITLSNLGMQGVKRFIAIINPPQSCIVAVGSILPSPAFLNEAWVARPIMTITASFDHRVLDGVQGAAFLNSLKELLENPLRLL